MSHPEGLRIARERIAEEAEKKTGRLNLSELGLTELPEEFFELPKGQVRELDCRSTQVSDLSPLAQLQSLQSLDCSDTQVSDLSPLADLQSLQGLDCRSTQVSDLSPLADLQSLQSLDCWDTQVSDLSPLADLQSLQSLDCWNTQVSDLSPLADLQSLQSLDCSYTQVSDLSPLADLQSLQSLDCWNTQVSDLSPLADLQSLQSLDCSYTQVSDLSPLADLQSLQSLSCRFTQVSDLSPLADLQSLQSLVCSNTQVSDLSPLADLQSLSILQARGLRLKGMPKRWLESAECSLELDLSGVTLPGFPSEILGEKCLPGLRSHVQDLKAGDVLLPDLKLMILGNGRIGKTQICRRLREEDYESNANSTHGIQATVAELKTPGLEPENTRLNLWDFGGQDLYHGTHALFMKSRAIFLLVWTPDSEDADEHETHGMTFRNQPLSWWLEYVRNLGGENAAVIVVQNQCDTASDERLSPPCENAQLEGFGFKRIIHYSAKEDRGRGTLDDSLREAVAFLREEEGVVRIGKGRAEVRNTLQRWLAEDAARDPEDRQHRLLTQEAFRQLCEKTGGVSSPEHLLQYLHNAGVVFYRKGLFKDRIILDQSWALNAIYTVFDRERCYKPLKTLGGRFTRSLLATLAWNDDGSGRPYAEAEQKLFLSLMEECGICFPHRRSYRSDDAEAEYVAPDLLPERSEIEGQLKGRWRPEETTEELAFRFPFLPPGHMRSIISEFGSEAGDSAVYWKNGVYFYEENTRSHAIIEQLLDESGPGGRIRVQTQGMQAEELLRRVHSHIERQNERSGFRDVTVEGDFSGHHAERQKLTIHSGGSEGEGPSPQDELDYGSPPQPDMREIVVSYAWKPELSEDPAQAGKVEAFCQRLDKAGIPVIRDNETMSLGERISDFERRIGAAERVFVFLSDRYLQSPHCMHELLSIYQVSQKQGVQFLQRVRVFTLPGTQISTIQARISYAAYWQKQYEEIDALIRTHGATAVASADLLAWKNMAEFHMHIGEMLAQMADVLRTGDFEEFVEAAIQEVVEEGSGQ